jgi:hypothetical protein
MKRYRAKVGDIVRVKTHANVRAVVTALPHSNHNPGFHFYVEALEGGPARIIRGQDLGPYPKAGAEWLSDASKVELIAEPEPASPRYILPDQLDDPAAPVEEEA